jgi:hypothetical protein
MMFGWPVLAVILFSHLHPRNAVLVSLIGAWLFLPMTIYDLPGIPAYSKTAASSLGILFGIMLFDTDRLVRFRPQVYDLPMLIWCLFCPIATSLSNDLGLYDGLASAVTKILEWGIPYLAGRIYFNNRGDLKDLAIAIVLGGVVYVPLCLYEVRMSPQLSNMFYGFFPHSFAQHVRFGGYRPIVFMQHGLMVSLWMAISTVVAFWLWRSRQMVTLRRVPMGIVVAALAVTTILCKSVNGWFTLLAGCGSYYLYNTLKMVKPFKLLIGIICGYAILRSTGLWDAQILLDLVARFIDQDRASSLAFRLTQEDLFSNWTMYRPWFGWGGYGRNRPMNIYVGQTLDTIDSLWLIAFSTYGYIGLASLFGAMLTGPWLALTRYSQQFGQKVIGTEGILLCLAVILFMVDSLFNSMVSPVYLMVTGGLLATVIQERKSLLINTGYSGNKITSKPVMRAEA